MKTTKQPLEACYYNGEKYCRVTFTEVDRENVNGNLRDSMEQGRIAFVDKKGKVLATCEPKQLSWIRQRQ